uniref:CTAGE family member 5 n=1 Tax=Gongylonema pulchrum TaxID=637853 RepID=A0A183ECZ3_9BILA
LKLKEMQMDEFLDAYDDLKANEEARIDCASNEIIRTLELISTNGTKLDLSSQITDTDNSALQGNENASAYELKDLHVRLQEELLSAEEMEERLETTNRNISERMDDLVQKMKQFENIDALKSGTELKRQDLEQSRKEFENVLPETEQYCQRLLENLAQKKSSLENSDEYIKLKNVQKKWQYVEQSTALLRETVAQRKAETNYQDFKDEVILKKLT